jgi:hypothetical protein
VQSPGGKARRKWFRAEALIPHGPLGLVHHFERSKAAHVVVDERRAGAQSESYGGVGRLGLVPDQHESPGHTQIHHQDPAPAQTGNDILPPPVHGFEVPAFQASGKIPRRLAKDIGVQNPDAFDRFSGQHGEEASNNRLDFR